MNLDTASHQGPVAPSAGTGTPAPSAASPPDDTHQALSPLAEAAALAHAQVAVVPVPMREQGPDWLPRPLALVAKALAHLPPHLRLVAQLWRLRDHDLVLVREFVTADLIVAWPALWPLRRRCYFLVNHNLQEAHRRGFERIVLRLLHHTGLRLACFETTAGFAEIGITPDAERFLVVPHPLPAAIAGRTEVTGRGEPVIGVIGSMRAEKGSDQLLATLVALRRDGRLGARLLLGCPEAEVRATWRERGFEVVDTAERAAYLEALDRADVVVLNYQEARYRHRPSGVAADALAHGATVVCPDFPLMRCQLTVPAPVGATFGAPAELGDAIARALALRPQLAESLRAHAAARGPRAIARIFDDLVARVLGPRRP